MAQTLMTSGLGSRAPQASLRQLMEAYERRLIIDALVRTHGKQRRAAAAVPLTASLARPTAAVVRRGAPLLDAASPSSNPAGTLREGEVVPVLDASGDWLQVEDNAGARGWTHAADVRRLDGAPAPLRPD